MKRIALLIAVAVALLVPASAMAQDSTCQAYNPQVCSSVEGVDGTSSSSSSSTLPFTGLDVALLAAGGGAFMAAGFVVRRLSQRTH